jgi:antirestriction protein ArdC
LNREAIQSISYGSHEYSEEELVAEFGAAELCGMAGIEPLTLENSAAYIANWHKRLKNEPEALIRAIKAASKGVKMILGGGEEDADG